jgi:hypothetical protein
MVRGSGWPTRRERRWSHVPNVVRVATGEVGCGGVRVGEWADWRPGGSRIGHWPGAAGRASLPAMALITPHRRAPRLGLLVSGSVYGALLTAAGLGIAYLALRTPLVSILSSDRMAGAGRPSIGLGILSFSLIAGGALLLAGANQLAVTLAQLRVRDRFAGPGARALASMADEVAVIAGVVPSEGRPIPEIAIGPFGAAVLHALPSGRQHRQVGTSWEYRERDGWRLMDNPLDQANRDAERVRRWLTIADLDFVVRVYAAVIVSDASIPRSATCAVVTPEQLPAWIGALPSQRSLTPARRLRLRSLAASQAAPTRDLDTRGW